MIRRIKFPLAAVLLVLAAGCAEMAPQVEIPPEATARACHERIALAGRFSVQYRKDGKDESAHGSFRWEQDGGSMHIELLSPLGQTLAVIDVTPRQATFASTGQAPRTAPDADALAAEMLGWQLPVSGLGDWLQGCMRDTRGRRVAMPAERASAPGGWQIAYPVWEASGSERRPKRIDLQRAGGHVAADISLRLVIDEWQPQ